MAVTIHSILEEFRQAATSNRDLGDKFERLFATYLTVDPLYADRFSDVWLWSEWPRRGNKPDTGIDLVAQERYTGEFCAIQCKFFNPLSTLDKSDIDSFFTASGKAPFTSRIIITTTDKWTIHAEEALRNQQIPVTRLRVQDLADSPIDWRQFSLKRPQAIKLRAKKKLRPHQSLALKKVLEGFKEADRGKLIMACGTGKTFTSLKIAEAMATAESTILFLVPSISLLSQTLREWTAEAAVTLFPLAVCSDAQVGKRGASEDISAHDLAFPASTNARKLATQVRNHGGGRQLTVIFSTYQSIQAIADAQARGVPEFDLIICDEAHRTTGVTLESEDESAFVRVHDKSFIKAKKRLYMTATPRIFNDGTKTQATDANAVLCSMDDQSLYGEEFHRLGFGEAVGKGLLADYKVMVLAVDEKYVSSAFQAQIADANHEINLEDATKIVGCWNGLSKRFAHNGNDAPSADDPAPMRRAVAFARSIKDSKRFAKLFNGIVDECRSGFPDEDRLLTCEVDHVDGTFNALRRNEKLDWLKADTTEQGSLCRILSNARCLSEGVDVPALDAVLFLNPRNSVVDVVQSVGRVMRKSEGKRYGYVILPIGVPADMNPEDALKDNQKYKVVWQVLQALRAHDDRFNATVNQLELNKARPDSIQVIGIGGGDGDDGWERGEGAKKDPSDAPSRAVQFTFAFPHLDEWRDAIYARIVQKCGDRRYWESWAKDVAQIAERHVTRIKALLAGPDQEAKKAFRRFLDGLHENLNPSISADEAIEMLSQHLITRPIFDALFEGYEFTRHNPVSVSMQTVLDALEGQALEKETESLEKFYASVRERAKGIDNAAGKQHVVKELYDSFFNAAFPKMAERLGIVYTPVEIVDYIVRSADEALRREFGVGLTDPGVHVLDPFAGTGTFIVRLLQSGLVQAGDLERKFQSELHANEIVLLAYYVAAINIEEVFHSLHGGEYLPFEGIVLTDTFQMTEGQGALDELMFPENNLRASRQSQTDIRVIFGNPPYSVGQDSENDGNQNQKYPGLDQAIRGSYVAKSSASLVRNLYDSYIRAFRWAGDRIKDRGIICYVSNGNFVGKNTMDGIRACLAEEFTSIYCFNLRGDARTSGEDRRREKGNVFGEGSRTPVAITLLVKNPDKSGDCELFYHDIGDYLSREEKLSIISHFGGISGVPWAKVVPNPEHDWIEQRDPAFKDFIPLGDNENENAGAVFQLYSLGVGTNRDAWAYDFSRENLEANMGRMLTFYNAQVAAWKKLTKSKPKDELPDIGAFIDTDSRKISWTHNLKRELAKFAVHEFAAKFVVVSMYRPFCKQRLYFNRRLNERVYRVPSIFPSANHPNLAIAVVGPGARQDFSALMVDVVPDLHLSPDGAQCFPLHFYEKVEKAGGDLLTSATAESVVKRDAIPDIILEDFRRLYGGKITNEDIFYYVYGILHSAEYKRRFAADLKKVLPRLPFADDFKAFSKAGRSLAAWHLNYETVDPWPLTEVSPSLGLDPKEHYRVGKMTFGKAGGKSDKTTIIYNSHITLRGIPPATFDYVVCGKPAIEWILERYQRTVDKDSGIQNDPNSWSDDPRYVIDLVKRIVRVSVESAKIVAGLPPLNERIGGDAAQPPDLVMA